MAYKNILVILDSSKHRDARMSAAIDLAARHEAHLVGLYIMHEIVIPSPVAVHVPVDIMEAQRVSQMEEADRVLAEFASQAEKAGVRSEGRKGRAFSDEITDLVGLNARYSDLVIMGQHDPDDDESPLAGVVEDVILTAGRPVLVTPYIGAKEGFGKNIIFAWDSSREAARAAGDALPLLQAAQNVTILCVNPSKGISGHGDEPGSDIATSLARHGIKAEAQHVVAPGIDISAAVLNRVAETGADMLVMGGYGHSRLRELILGGVTHDILKQMTVPTLLSH